MDIKTLVAGPNYIFYNGLINTLKYQAGFSTVHLCESMETFREHLIKINPDLCIIDYDFFKIINTNFQILHISPSTSKFIFFADQFDDYDIFYTMSIGAFGLINKNISSIDLFNLLSGLFTEGVFVSNLFCDNVKQINDSIKQRIRISIDNVTTLTVMELNIFHDYGKGYTTAKVANKRSLSKDTIDTHRRNIMQKLNLHSMDDFLLNARHFINISRGVTSFNIGRIVLNDTLCPDRSSTNYKEFK